MIAGFLTGATRFRQEWPSLVKKFLGACIVTEADWVFGPEWPLDTTGSEKLCTKLNRGRLGAEAAEYHRVGGRHRQTGELHLGRHREEDFPYPNQRRRDVAQSATKTELKPRLCVPWPPSAKNVRPQCAAVLALMDATPAAVVSLDGNAAIRVPLMDCVQKTQVSINIVYTS